jgi:hypothetical protein
MFYEDAQPTNPLHSTLYIVRETSMKELPRASLSRRRCCRSGKAGVLHLGTEGELGFATR